MLQMYTYLCRSLILILSVRTAGAIQTLTSDATLIHDVA